MKESNLLHHLKTKPSAPLRLRLQISESDCSWKHHQPASAPSSHRMLGCLFLAFGEAGGKTNSGMGVLGATRRE